VDRFHYLIVKAILIFFLLSLLLSGCATVQVPTRSIHIGKTDRLGNCADFFLSLDKRIEKSKVFDPAVFRVKGYPYLRINRFLASFRQEVKTKAAFAAWVDRLQTLDQDARKYEIANLTNLTELTSESLIDASELNSRIAICGDLLKNADFQDFKKQEDLRNIASAPDDYITLRRFLGFYPLTGLFVSHGVNKWQAKVHKSFSLEPPVGWRTIRYGPTSKIDVSKVHQILASTERDALGIPIYSPEIREALFQMYAPVWEIQLQDNNDRIGTPIWTSTDRLDVNIDQPLTYTLLSFTRFDKEILTQLNYIVWFPERLKESALDIYGGLLDGLNYRVTLDNDGKPVLYETVHNCGCYYKAYPTDRLQVREKMDYAEPPLILKAPELDPSKHFLTVAMQSRTHFVKHLYPLPRNLQPAMLLYSLAAYGQLRSLPFSRDKRKSMFGQDSIVPGSERLERFILWPTGVLSPGAMRQWGRHAVAFVGKRHFDDPFFMDEMYIRSSSN
jgi:hypothetical protein